MDSEHSPLPPGLVQLHPGLGVLRLTALFAEEQGEARALIKRLIDCWRTLAPVSEPQRAAHGRLPSATRLLDTVSIWMEERAQRKGPGGARRRGRE